MANYQYIKMILEQRKYFIEQNRKCHIRFIGLFGSQNYGLDDETQSNNRRTNVYLTAFGKTMTIAQWSRYTGINNASIEYRHQSKYFNTDEEIIFGKNLIYYKGEL